LGKLLKIRGKASYLITMGTAIGGGSAIATLSPIAEANEEEISISMGTVFLLNSVALLVFPSVGWWLHLSQNQFGLWAALAIHDQFGSGSIRPCDWDYGKVGPRALDRSDIDDDGLHASVEMWTDFSVGPPTVLSCHRHRNA
jgi:hypothetical protein